MNSVARLAAEVSLLVTDWLDQHPAATEEDLHAVEGDLIRWVIPRDPIDLLAIAGEDPTVLTDTLPSHHRSALDALAEAIQVRVDQHYNTRGGARHG